jgi:hypothetical protein
VDMETGRRENKPGLGQKPSGRIGTGEQGQRAGPRSMRQYRVWRRGGTDTLLRVPCTCPFGAPVVGSLRSSNHAVSLAGAGRGGNTAEILG